MAKKQEKKPESHICYLCDKSIEPDEALQVIRDTTREITDAMKGVWV